MAEQDLQFRIDKVLRRERGERLFLARGSDRTQLLVTQVLLPAGDHPAPALRERLSRLLTIQSPHLPRLVSLEFKPDGVVELVSPDSGGVFLADLMVHGRLPPAQALAVWEQLLAALAPLHDKEGVYGLCHPEAILFNRRNQAILPEVGRLLALEPRLQGGMARAGSLLQRLFREPDLVPPELLNGGPLTPAADVYQSAALAFRLFAGVGAFGDGLSLEVYNRMLHHQCEALLGQLPDSGIPLSDILEECLHPDPKQRPANAARLRTRLAALEHPREALSERIVGQPEKHYSDRFPGILAVHSGGGENGLVAELATERENRVADVEKEVLLDQLEQLRTRRRQKPARRWGNWVAVGLALLAVVVALPYLLELGTPPPREHEGRLSADSDGQTHREVVWHRGDDGAFHPTVNSLMSSLTPPLRERLEQLGLPLTGEMAFEAPVLPPYRVVCRGADGQEVTYEFTARNRLHAVSKAVSPIPGAPVRYVVLYDAQGVPRAIAVQDVTGRTEDLVSVRN